MSLHLQPGDNFAIQKTVQFFLVISGLSCSNFWILCRSHVSYLFFFAFLLLLPCLAQAPRADARPAAQLWPWLQLQPPNTEKLALNTQKPCILERKLWLNSGCSRIIGPSPAPEAFVGEARSARSTGRHSLLQRHTWLSSLEQT